MELIEKILGLFSRSTKTVSVKDRQTQPNPTPAVTDVRSRYNSEDLPAPSGEFKVIVVGVSYYQAVLGKICGKKSEMFVRARIVPEENNLYDSNAIKIEVEGETIGYLSRENALKWRNKMTREGFSDAVTCPARIKWDRAVVEEGSYGVWLDVDLTFPDSIPTTHASKKHDDPDFQEFLKTDGFIFSLYKPRIQDITHVGISVNLWIPKNPDTVFIYHRNGPYGPIGTVPPRYSEIVISHLLSAMNYDARIVELAHNTCKIKCKLFSREEDKRRKEQHKASLKEELTKAYRPKKPVMLTIVAKKVTDIKEGDRLMIKFEDSDSYGGPHSYPYQVRFLDQEGHAIGILDNNKSTIQRLLKAHYNSYQLDVEISRIDRQRIRNGYPLDLVITPRKSKGDS